MFAKQAIRRLFVLGLVVVGMVAGAGQAQAQFRYGVTAPTITHVYHDTAWIEVQWTDNSTNETEFRVSYRLQGAPSWTIADTVPSNRTASLIPKPASSGNYEFRVTARQVSGIYVIAQASSPTFARQIRAERIAPPSNFRIAEEDQFGPVLVRWVDNSSDEYGFVVQYRLQGDCYWNRLDDLPPNTTKAYVSLPYYSNWELRVVAEANFTYYELNELSAGSNSECVTAGPMEG